MNNYAPYKEIKTFLDFMENKGFLSLKNLVIAGDLNITRYAYENWGMVKYLDPLACFFQGLFKRNRMIDVISNKLSPT